VVFIGDDHSDEMVFASFAAADADARDRTLGVKVGVDDSVATHRLRAPGDVVTFLQLLARLLAG
jgi:trehalose-6-phosphatase